ncbi:hypothetical protein KEM56_001311 [Ascosphaera pollenicola]|nr:hypothetical protein KEM56_001311 [Ascosphaera pollenicola]
MRLNHLHIPGIIPFSRASQIQSTLVSRFLTHKKNAASSGSSRPKPPSPTIFTFMPTPVYTSGRREIPPGFSEESRQGQVSELELPPSLQAARQLLEHDPPLASYHPTLRGGQTTYHGPGQLVIYTIMDLKTMRLGPRTHIETLERSVMDLLSKFHIRSMRTGDPGVWIPPRDAPVLTSSEDAKCCPPTPEGASKIAAVGVHLRRFISSYGVGFNITNDPFFYFRHIVPCGIEGRQVTSLMQQGVEEAYNDNFERKVADMFVDAFVARVNKNFESDPSAGIQEVHALDEKQLFL